MVIGTAVQRGQSVYVQNAKGTQLFVQPGELHEYTGATVSIRRGKYIYTFNEHGRQLSVTPG